MILMKKITKQLCLLLFAVMVVSSCSNDDDIGQGVVFEPYTFEATASGDTILVGETVTFMDKSDPIVDREWSFPGGTPATSKEPNVTVTYETAGTFAAQITISYRDSSIKIHKFPIVVIGEEEEPVITGPTYGVFTELAEVTPGITTWFISAAGIKFMDNPYNYPDQPFEGSAAQRFTLDLATNTWGMAMIQGRDGTADLSEFANGYLNFAIKSTSTAPVKIRARGAGLDVSIDLAIDDYGFKRDGEWHMVSIPMADLMVAIPEADRATTLEKVADLFMIRSVDGTDFSTLNNFDFDVDNVFYSVNKPEY